MNVKERIEKALDARDEIQKSVEAFVKMIVEKEKEPDIMSQAINLTEMEVKIMIPQYAANLFAHVCVHNKPKTISHTNWHENMCAFIFGVGIHKIADMLNLERFQGIK